MTRYGRWATSPEGPRGYANRSALQNAIQYGVNGAIALRQASEHQEERLLEEAIEEGMCILESRVDYADTVRCLKARYLNMIRGVSYPSLSEREKARFLGMPRETYYRKLNHGLEFIRGWLSAKGLLNPQ